MTQIKADTKNRAMSLRDRAYAEEGAIEFVECMKCKHWYTHSGQRCGAFPDGIPAKIMNMEIKHREPYAGDHGLQFESIQLD